MFQVFDLYAPRQQHKSYAGVMSNFVDRLSKGILKGR